MPFAIPRVLVGNTTEAFDWLTFPLVNDISVNSVTALLEFSIETQEEVAIYVRADGDVGPGFKITSFMSTDNGKTSIIGGQGMCPISEDPRSIQIS